VPSGSIEGAYLIHSLADCPIPSLLRFIVGNIALFTYKALDTGYDDM